jgi:YGGT family
MFLIVHLLFHFCIVALFLYSKLLPYKDRLSPQYAQYFSYAERLFSPILDFFRSVVKPFEVGTGLSIDMSQILLLIILLFLVNIR